MRLNRCDKDPHGLCSTPAGAADSQKIDDHKQQKTEKLTKKSQKTRFFRNKMTAGPDERTDPGELEICTKTFLLNFVPNLNLLPKKCKKDERIEQM